MREFMDAIKLRDWENPVAEHRDCCHNKPEVIPPYFVKNLRVGLQLQQKRRLLEQRSNPSNDLATHKDHEKWEGEHALNSGSLALQVLDCHTGVLCLFENMEQEQ